MTPTGVLNLPRRVSTYFSVLFLKATINSVNDNEGVSVTELNVII